MEKKLQKSRRKLESFHQQDKKISKNLVIGSVIATFIALTPYLFYLYESVPQGKVWDTFLFTYSSAYWEDVNYAMWVLTGKLIPLFLLFIWFFTCRHWWYHALLVPIAMYLFQIIVMLNEDVGYMDQFQLIYLIPVMAIVVPSIYLIRAKIFNKVNDANKSMQELEDEFKIKPKGVFGKLSDYF
jgi:hypothetical protein